MHMRQARFKVVLWRRAFPRVFPLGEANRGFFNAGECSLENGQKFDSNYSNFESLGFN